MRYNPGGGGERLSFESDGLLIVSVSGVIADFGLTLIGRSGQKANIFTHTGIG